ncbi:MAG: MFS transporter [Treponema sp.]
MSTANGQQAHIHRARLWEIGFYALNNTSTNIYLMLYMYLSYYLTGLVGTTVLFAGTAITAMRIWDGITDPFVGFIVDKTNSKFGKNRPFIVIGHVIMFITSFIVFKYLHVIPNAARIPAFIAVYALYIIGYTFQCVVTKSAQTCMTNDPKQRPMFAMFDMIYNAVLFAGIPMYVVQVIMPKYGGQKVALNAEGFYMELFFSLAVVSAVCMVAAILGIRRKDRPEYYGTGRVQKIAFKDYWEVLKNNRAIQMLVVSAASDKLAALMQQNQIIYVMLFGIIAGDYTQYSLMNGVTIIPVIIVSLLFINFVARKMGQKAAIIVSSWSGIITMLGIFLLFRFGNPATLDLGFKNGTTVFTVLFLILFVLNKASTNMATSIVIPMTADCADYEVYRSGKYVPGLMGTLFSFVDKIISAFSQTFVSLAIFAIGYTHTQPQPGDVYTESIFWATMVCFAGFPIFGWLCNIVAMKFYSLSQSKMEEIQMKIAEIKRAAQAAE